MIASSMLSASTFPAYSLSFNGEKVPQSSEYLTYRQFTEIIALANVKMLLNHVDGYIQGKLTYMSSKQVKKKVKYSFSPCSFIKFAGIPCSLRKQWINSNNPWNILEKN